MDPHVGVRVLRERPLLLSARRVVAAVLAIALLELALTVGCLERVADEPRWWAAAGALRT